MKTEFDFHDRVFRQKGPPRTSRSFIERIGSRSVKVFIEGHTKFRVIFADVRAAMVIDQKNGPDALSKQVELKPVQHLALVRPIEDTADNVFFSHLEETFVSMIEGGSVLEDHVVVASLELQKSGTAFPRIIGVGAQSEFGTGQLSVDFVIVVGKPGIVEVEAPYQILVVRFLGHIRVEFHEEIQFALDFSAHSSIQNVLELEAVKMELSQ